MDLSSLHALSEPFGCSSGTGNQVPLIRSVRGEEMVASLATSLALCLGVALFSLSNAAFTNSVSYGQQLCVMLRSGISQEKAWEYIRQEHLQAALARPPLQVPVYSSSSAGLAFGLALGQAEQANKELAAMKPDVLKVARATCPEQFR